MIGKLFGGGRQLGLLLAISLLIFPALPKSAFAEPFSINRELNGVFLGKHVMHLEDKTKALTFGQVKSAETFSKFSFEKPETLNFGMSSSAHWLYFQVRNDTAEELPWILQMEYTLFSMVEVYEEFPGGETRFHEGGNQIPFDRRDIKHRKNAFAMSAKPGATSVFVKVTPLTRMVMDFYMTAFTDKYFDEKNSMENLLLGLYYGALVALLFYNLFIYVSVRDVSYLWYILYLTGAMLAYFAINGLGFEYIWPNSAYAAREWPFAFYAVAYTFVFLFARTFLETSKFMPAFDKVLAAGAVINGLFAWVSFADADFHFIMTFAYPMTIIYPPVLLYAGARSLNKGSRQARYYVAAWVVFLLGMPLYLLKDMGFLADSFVTTYSVQIGTLFEAVLLSLALADRINILRQEKEKAEAYTREVLQKSRDELEARVAERTIQLAESENRFKQLSNAAFEAIVVHEGGVILDVNTAAEEISGYSAEELIGRDALMFISPAYLEEARKKIAADSQDVYEIIGMKKDGSPVTAEIRGRKMNYMGRQVRVVAIRDVTARKETENALRVAKEKAEDATKLKDNFVSLVSHDLRSPVGGMRMSLETLCADQTLGQKTRQYLALLVNTCKDILDLTDRLLDVTRMQSGRMRPLKKVVHFKQLVDRTIASLAPLAANKEIAVKNEILRETRVYGDPALLGECVANLLSNAIKFTNNGGEVVFFQPDGVRGAIGVRDNGVGISPSLIKDLFKTHVRTTTQGTNGEKGTGLGLPYCKDIVEAHGGSVRVESEVGKGSVFHLELPDSKPSVLVVDDKPATRFLARKLLEELEVEVFEAEDGQDALEKLDMVEPKLIITDINMPRMDGFELIRELKSSPEYADIAVIAATSGDDGSALVYEVRTKVVQLGADDFVSIPYERNDLLPRVARLLE